MDSLTKTLIFVTFLFFLLLQTDASKQSPAALLKSICDQTDDSTFCLQTLQSDPRTSKASKVITLANIALELAVNDAQKSTHYILDLYNKETNPKIKPPLNECVMWFNATMLSFRSAHLELKEDPPTANYDAKIAGDDAGYCGTALADANVTIEAVSYRIQVAKHFSSIGDVVTNNL